MEDNFPLPKYKLCVMTSFQGIQYGTWGPGGITLQKPATCYLQQVAKVHIDCNEAGGVCAPLIRSDENGTLPLWSFPHKTHNPSLIMRKTSDKSQLRNSLQNIWLYSSSLSRSSKRRNVWKTVILNRSLRKYDKISLVYWMGSQNKQMTLGKI